MTTGRPLSELQRATASPLEGYPLRYGHAPRDRAALHAHRARRFGLMMEAGFLEEVRGLRARGDLSAKSRHACGGLPTAVGTS